MSAFYKKWALSMWFAFFIALLGQYVDCGVKRNNNRQLTSSLNQCSDPDQLNATRCFLCTRDEDVLKLNSTTINKEDIQRSCYRDGYYHLFHYGSSPVSILTPSSQTKWCYVEVNYKGQCNDRLYVGHNGDTCSETNKWSISSNWKKHGSQNIRNIYRYKIRPTNNSGKESQMATHLL